jgi:hypothetical protein
VVGTSNCDLMVSDDSSVLSDSHLVDVVLEDMGDLSKNVLRMSNQTVGGAEELGGIAVFLQHAEHLVDLSVVVNGGVMYDAMELVNQLHLVDGCIHFTLLEVNMTF